MIKFFSTISLFLLIVLVFSIIKKQPIRMIIVSTLIIIFNLPLYSVVLEIIDPDARISDDELPFIILFVIFTIISTVISIFGIIKGSIMASSSKSAQ